MTCVHSIGWGNLLNSGRSEEQGDMGDECCSVSNIPVLISSMDVDKSVELTALYVV
jgi:hypothetical protein